MKLIIAIVRPFTIERMVVAFEEIEDFPGMTVVDSAGFGQRLRNTVIDSLDPFRQNRRIEIACNGDMTDQIISVIKKSAHTGKKGDGIIMVLPIESSVLI